jgi:hypothetical protein
MITTESPDHEALEYETHIADKSHSSALPQPAIMARACQLSVPKS